MKLAAAFGLVLAVQAAEGAEAPWRRHVIDGSSSGADGARFADTNGDGFLDVATGWEEGGVTRICLNPGPERVRGLWPGATIGSTPAVEDAVWADLDGDGTLEVVSSCEGSAQVLKVHWSAGRTSMLNSGTWRSQVVPASRGKMQWMFALPLQVDGTRGIDIVAGGKGPGAQIGWFEAPSEPRNLEDWRWHPWHAAGWIMSIAAEDMNGDGRVDVVYSDRRGAASGVYWLENPGAGAGIWQRHAIGGLGREVMFLDLADLDGDGLRDVVAAVKPRELMFFRRKTGGGLAWSEHIIRMPENTGGAKAVAVGDLNVDGKADLVFSCEGAADGKHGLMWLSFWETPFEEEWQPHLLSGSDGVKHDLVTLLDLDADGDLDVITCEETKNLGVIWYENPVRN